MFQTIITYEKATLRAISAVQVDTIIANANILKVPTHGVLITAKKDALYRNEKGEMYLRAEYVKEE